MCSIKIFKSIDRWLDFCPIISTPVNAIIIVAKIAFALLAKFSPWKMECAFVKYIKKKNECLTLLLLIPGVNIWAAGRVYSRHEEKQAEQDFQSELSFERQWQQCQLPIEDSQTENNICYVDSECS